MNKSLIVLASVIGLLWTGAEATAQSKPKEVTITGEAVCAMCMLKEGQSCQTVIQVKKGNKTETYKVAANDVSKGFKEDVCHASHKVTATGTVKKVEGKLEITLSKIEAAK